jgi:hypothetical protein
MNRNSKGKEACERNVGCSRHAPEENNDARGTSCLCWCDAIMTVLCRNYQSLKL